MSKNNLKDHKNLFNLQINKQVPYSIINNSINKYKFKQNDHKIIWNRNSQPSDCNAFTYYWDNDYRKLNYTILFPNCCSMYIDANKQKRIRHITSLPSIYCSYDYFSMNYYGKTIQYSCYDSMCNTLDYAQNLIQQECENSKYLMKDLNLEIEFDYSKQMKSTNECYFCDNCENPFEDISKIKCNPYNLDNMQYSCQVNIIYNAFLRLN